MQEPATTPATRLRLDAIIRTSQQNSRDGDSYRSPVQQREAIERWAAVRGVEIVTWHDATRGRNSAKSVERAEVDAVIERVKARQTDGAVVMSLDRFSRAPLHETLAVYKRIEDEGGRVCSADMPFEDPTSPEAEWFATSMLAHHRYQWRKVQQRYAQSRRDAIRDGKTTGLPSLGYRYTDPTPKRDGRGVLDSRLVVIEAHRHIVGELFGRKAAGATWLELARWLDSVTPKPDGRPWGRNTVISLIRSRTFLGEARSGEYVNLTAHDPLVSEALWRRAQNPPGRRTPRGAYELTGLVRCAGCGHRMQATSGGRGRKPPVFQCVTRDCPLLYLTVAVKGLDAEVTEQLFNRLETFHVRVADDEELAAAEAEVERLGVEVDALAAVAPQSKRGIAAHQAALDDAETALAAAEDRRDHLLASTRNGGPDVRELRAEWPRLTVTERREILRAGIDVVLVRRAASRTAPHPPVADRLLVLFRGDAPAGLVDNGRSGHVQGWSWGREPSSLVAAS